LVLVEAVEETLGIWRAGRPSAWSTATEAFGAATFTRTSRSAITSVTITIIGTARTTSATSFWTTTFTAGRTIRATAPFWAAISGRADVEVLAHGPADRAGFFVVECAVFVGVEIVEQFLLHGRIALGRFVGRLLGRLGNRRQCQQARAEQR
jgi:hypothetical protein